MNNRDVEYLRGLYTGILADVSEAYPYDHKDWGRDLSRLSYLLEHRGISTFTVELPDLGKMLDRALADGHLTRTGKPLSRSTRRSEIAPKLFRGLFRRVFHEDGRLRDDADVTAVRFLRQLLYCGKKLKMDCSVSATMKTVAEFYDVDREVRPGSNDWNSDDPEFVTAHLLSLEDELDNVQIPLSNRDLLSDALDTMQQVADVVVGHMGVFDPYAYTPKHGPGAVADQKRWENKYLFPHWPAKLERVFPSSDFAFANHGEWAAAVSSPDVEYGLLPDEPPSRLIAVPKTQKGPRLIAAEPIAHQWCQQMILDFFTDRVSRSTSGSGNSPLAGVVEFNNQNRSREAARRASLHGDAWTIDLSSASDRVSCWLVERVFRRNPFLLHALHASRTRRIVNTIDKKSPHLYELRKFSTMGSAVTFPVQSIIFAIAALAAVLHENGVEPSGNAIRKWRTGVHVFGDDIIIPSYAGPTLVALLEHLGLKVNHDKSYGNGNFRESCGMDAFRGHDVTPAYATQRPQQTRPESMISAVEQCRNFFKRGYEHAATAIKSTCMGIPLLRGLPHTPVDSGILGYPTWCDTVPPPKRRWNSDLFRMEYFYPRPLARTRQKDSQGSTGFLRFFTEGPGPDFVWSSKINQRPSLHLRRSWGPLPA